MRRALLLVGIAVALVLASCRPAQLAGRSVGQFRMSGSLVENTCGDGYPAPATLSFYVELRDEPSSNVGYWKLPEGAIVSGSLDARGAFRFEERSQVEGVPADPALGVVGCTVEQVQVVSGELGGDAPSADAGAVDAGADAGTNTPTAVADLAGETTITVTPVVGSDCSPLLLPFGGAFPVLPCRLRYTLEGEELDQPLW